MSRARIVDPVPDQRGACAHQPPVLFFPPDYVHNLCLNSSGTGPVACTSLQHVSVAVTWGRKGTLGLPHHENLGTAVCNPVDPNPPPSMHGYAGIHQRICTDTDA